VTSEREPAGENCANGGSKFTAASGDTYACSGAKGDKGNAGAGTLMASSETTATTNLSTSCTDYAGGTVTINAPGPGDVVVDATVDLMISHAAGTTDTFRVGVVDSPGACPDFFSPGRFAIPASLPSATGVEQTVQSRRAFHVATGGTYTYRINGVEPSGSSTPDSMYWGRMDAVYYPAP
jgi:hypothetical protein